MVDEAGQATEPITILPFVLANRDTHIVLIGDHMQLAPTVHSDTASFEGLGTSMFERLIRVGGIDSCMLTVQYRMHESICSWPSREFYEEKLVSDSSVRNRERVERFPWPADSAFAFIDIQGEEQLSETQSVSNHVEARLAINIVKHLLYVARVQAADIGVITPYDAQTILMKLFLEEEKLADVEAANIDAFQGREKEVVVLSLVRSNREHELGFVDDIRRVNVGLTRAKRGLVVIGGKDTLKYGYESGLTSFIRNVYERGLVIQMPRDQRGASAFLDDVAKKVVIDIHEARMIAKTIDAQKSTKHEHQIVQTRAAWIPLAHCGDLPSLDETVDRLI